jgi:hypothetical protein
MLLKSIPVRSTCGTGIGAFLGGAGACFGGFGLKRPPPKPLTGSCIKREKSTI